MFIIELTYKVGLEKIDEYINDHIDYLNTQYELGNFQLSGKKIPRTGGIILSIIQDKSTLLEILNQDPFKKYDFADYNLTEFIPTKTSKELSFLVD